MKKRPSFIVSFSSALHGDVKERGWKAFIPVYSIASCAMGILAAGFLPSEFWMNDNWDVSTAVYGGLLAFNGLLLALGWSSFSKIYEIVSSGRIGKILQRNDLLAEHLAFIDGNHVTLILAACANGIGLVTVLIALPLVADRLIFTIAIGTTLYALVRALASTRMMSDLIWEQAHLIQESIEPNEPRLKSIGGK